MWLRFVENDSVGRMIADSSQVLERSRFATETGAAMHMAPNATALLEWMDVRPSEVGGTLLRQVCFAIVAKRIRY